VFIIHTTKKLPSLYSKTFIGGHCHNRATGQSSFPTKARRQNPKYVFKLFEQLSNIYGLLYDSGAANPLQSGNAFIADTCNPSQRSPELILYKRVSQGTIAPGSPDLEAKASRAASALSYATLFADRSSLYCLARSNSVAARTGTTSRKYLHETRNSGVLLNVLFLFSSAFAFSFQFACMFSIIDKRNALVVCI
jgi:hypothetical protein